MRKIYILTTYTGTVLSFFIKKVTGVPYSHVSIGMNEELTSVYSFGRKYVSNPIIAGFVKEDIKDGLYKKKTGTECRVYGLEVTDEQYDKMSEIINNFVENKEYYKYDASALYRFLLQSTKSNDKKFVCSQFVAYVLEKSGIELFDKDSKDVTPLDFFTLEGIAIEYEGLLSGYSRDE